MGDGADDAYDRAMDEMLYPDYYDYGYDPSDFEEEQFPLVAELVCRPRNKTKRRATRPATKKGTKHK